VNSKTKKILIVSAAYPPDIKGGGEKSTQLLAQGLTDLDNDVTVLTCSQNENERIDPNGKIKIISIVSPNIYWNFNPQQNKLNKLIWHFKENHNPSAVDTVEQYLAQLKPDIVITSTIENFGSSVWLACHRLQIPVIHILRSYYMLCFKGTMFSNEKICQQACVKCKLSTIGKRDASRYVNGLVGISGFILGIHNTLFINSLKTVINNPVDIPKKLPTKTKTNNDIVFGYLGRIEPEKGIEDLITGFLALPDNCRLIIAGKGTQEYENYIKNKYNSNRIDFIGWVEAADVYRTIDYAIVPSVWNEPFGRVVIEAYSYGVPVIAAARGGLSELIEDGITGALYEPSKKDSLKTACLRIIEKHPEIESMRKTVFKQSKLYSIEKIATEYDQFLNAVIENKDT
jgi:glycosyltransferase involved in cell wall biosynthesis